MKFLDFEHDIAQLSSKINELKKISHGDHLDLMDEIQKLQEKSDKLLKQIYDKLTPTQILKVARHEDRPRGTFFIKKLFNDFVPLAGDRLYGEDCALITGIGRFYGVSCMVIAHEKGSDVQERVKRNFAMAKPEGYRKAIRMMRLAERFNLPIITLIDTAGAYPGIDAEERGQAEAIARSIQTCIEVKTPILSVIIGEGGSGGAVAIACGDYIGMLRYSVYSVISPEGCASILWRRPDAVSQACESLKITAHDLLNFQIIDELIDEPLGGAHRNPNQMASILGETLNRELKKIINHDTDQLVIQRRNKFLNMTLSHEI